MSISLVRVDDRMIHGQIVLMWTKFYQGDAIVVLADEKVTKDKFMVNILKKSGNAMNKKVFVFGVEEAIEKLPKVIESNKRYFLISKQIHLLAEVRRAGIDFGDTIIFGTASQKSDTVKVYNNIYLSAEDVNDCKYLDSQGVTLNFKLIPDEEGTTWNNVKKIFN